MSRWNREVQRYAPSRPEDYADALEFLIRRYGPRVQAWEIGNEPNLRHYFRADDPAAAYAAVLKTAYRRAKTVDPSAYIVGGALSASDTAFVRALLSHGIAGSFDAFSLHPYSENSSPLDPFPDQYVASSFVRGVPRVHDTLTAAGVDAPLWLTEFGWSTCDRRDARDWWFNCVTETQQAQFVDQAFTKLSQWPYVAAGFVYKAIDDGGAGSPTGNPRETSFGLLRPDGTSKPALESFRRAAARMRASAAPVLDLPVPPVPLPTPTPTPTPKAPPVAVPTPDPATTATPVPPAAEDAASVDPPRTGAAPEARTAASVVSMRLLGSATTCRDRCLRHPDNVQLQASRPVQVAISVQLRKCLRTCRWVVRARTEIRTTQGKQQWSLSRFLRARTLAPGRWRLRSTPSGGSPAATSEAAFTVAESRSAPAR